MYIIRTLKNTLKPGACPVDCSIDPSSLDLVNLVNLIICTKVAVERAHRCNVREKRGWKVAKSGKGRINCKTMFSRIH